MLISESPNLLAVLAAVAVASLVGLVVQAAIEHAAIVAIGIGGRMAAWLLSMPGTNGEFLILALAYLAVAVLTLRFVFTHVTEPRVWFPVGGLIIATSAGAAIVT